MEPDSLLNSTEESVQTCVTMKILKEEEESFVMLLKSMYYDVLPNETSFSLLKIIVEADKYEVPSCLSRCSELLQSRPMSVDLAICCFACQNEFGSNTLISEFMLPTSLWWLNSRIWTTIEAHILELPLHGLELILSSDYLESKSESSVYNLTVSWLKKNIKDAEERSKMLKRLVSHIRFPLMTPTDLRNLLKCSELGPSIAHNIVLEALFQKLEGDSRFVQRAYKVPPVKMLELDLPYPVATIYLDMTLDQVRKMYPNGEAHSEKFRFKQDAVDVYARCTLDKKTSGHFFGMMLSMTSTTDDSYKIEFEFACRREPTKEFVPLLKSKCTWRKTEGNQGMEAGNHNMIAWDELISENSPHFINGVSYFRIGLRVKK